MYVAVLFGIVFLMTTKPATSAATLAMVIAAAAGLLASLPLWWRARVASRSVRQPQGSAVGPCDPDNEQGAKEWAGIGCGCC